MNAFRPLPALLTFAAVVGLDCGSAVAEEASAWARDNHSAVRLLAGSRNGAVLLGGIEFELQDGWKTYWRTPGDSGVPPRFDFSKSDNVDAVTVLWPAPLKFGRSSAFVELRAKSGRPWYSRWTFSITARWNRASSSPA